MPIFQGHQTYVLQFLHQQFIFHLNFIQNDVFQLAKALNIEAFFIFYSSFFLFSLKFLAAFFYYKILFFHNIVYLN